MEMNRRQFVGSLALASLAASLAGAAAAAAAADGPKVRVGGRTGTFGGKWEAAKKAGLDGVEIGVGGAADKLSITNPDWQKRTKDDVEKAGLVVSSLSMDLLNSNPLATDELPPAWVEQTIAACAALGAGAILVPFFGKAHMLAGKEWKPEITTLVERLRKLAPVAKDAGVKLGLECTLSGKQFNEILDRVDSEWVGAYYDIGNSTGAGLVPADDIKTIGARIAMVHFKDGGNFLGEGKVDIQAAADALKAVDYRGWIILETSCPTGNGEADCTKNTAAVRRVMGI